MPPDGVLIVDKPAGLTSRRVVDRLAALAGESKAGHAGTLDPLATGLLVVCLGRATLLSAYLGKGTKKYSVECSLGLVTETYDTDGRTTARADAAGVDAASIKHVLGGFIGEQKQTPPAYSAVKQDGVRLHRLARAGAEVRPRQRTVRVESIELVALREGETGPVAVLDVTCGPGTYVRSLAHDIGTALGCGACVSGLRRLASGPFSLTEALALAQLERMSVEEIRRAAMTMEEATAHMPSLTVGPQEAEAASMGKPMSLDGARALNEDVFRVIDAEGRLVALYGPPREGDDPEISARAVRVIRPHNESEGHEAA